MEFTQSFWKLLYSGDPVIRTWFLVQNDYLPFILCAFYAVFSSYLGPTLMKNRKPFDLRMPMIVFNFSIVTTYVITLLTVFWNFRKVTWKQFCTGDVVIYGEPTYVLASCGWMMYIIKFVECFDTVFFVLRKKQNLITFLHVLHHTIVPLIGWVMLRTERSGFQSIPVIINAIVHVVMYTYYGLAAMGPQVQKHLWWKKYLTQMQMIQFVLIVVIMVGIAPRTGCSMIQTSYFIDLTVAPLFLYLFYRYYQVNFSRKNSSALNGEAKRGPFSRNGTLRNGEEKNGMRTNGEEKNGVRRNGEEKNGMRRNGEEKNGVRRNGEEKNGILSNGRSRKDD